MIDSPQNPCTSMYDYVSVRHSLGLRTVFDYLVLAALWIVRNYNGMSVCRAFGLLFIEWSSEHGQFMALSSFRVACLHPCLSA